MVVVDIRVNAPVAASAQVTDVSRTSGAVQESRGGGQQPSLAKAVAATSLPGDLPVA